MVSRMRDLVQESSRNFLKLYEVLVDLLERPSGSSQVRSVLGICSGVPGNSLKRPLGSDLLLRPAGNNYMVCDNSS